MKRVAILLNANKLGGAERSIILQTKKICNENIFTFYIPRINKTDTVKNQIEELIKLMQDEIRDMPAVTTLVVFALGIIMGRHLR